ncbi:YIP1 family protein [Sulfitobacter sp. LCG007]
MTRHIDWGALALMTLRAPAEAAAIIAAWELPRQVLWMGLALVAILNTFLFSLSEMIVPTSMPLPGVITNPLVFFVTVAGGLIASVHVFYWTGRMLGAPVRDMGPLLALMIWLQALRGVVQAAVLVLLLVSPAISALLVFAASLYAVWILLNFLSVGLGLQSVWRALGVLVAGSLALVLGISILLSFIDVGAIGLIPNV